ncbi:MAG: hypothetical protein WC700_19490 [Gemmatimonadaceae bacterium]|jgi:hypothetical protein
MKTVAVLFSVILMSVMSCEPCYAQAPYATTVTAPAPSAVPVLGIVPGAQAAPAKRLQTAIPVNDKAAAIAFPDLVPVSAVGATAPVMVSTASKAAATPVSADPSMPWQQQVLYYLLGFLSLLLTALVPVLVKWLTAKAKMDITATQEALYNDLARKAIQNMEELAHRAIKAEVNPPTGNEKLNGAVADIIATANDLGLARKASSEVVRLVESHLGGTRDNASVPPAGK